MQDKVNLYILRTKKGSEFACSTSEVLIRTDSGTTGITRNSIITDKFCLAYVSGAKTGDFIGGIGSPILVSSLLAEFCRHVRLPDGTTFTSVQLLDDATGSIIGQSMAIHFSRWFQVFDDTSFKAYQSRSLDDRLNQENMPFASKSLIPNDDLFQIAGATVCSEYFFMEATQRRFSNIEFERIPVH